MRTYIIRLSLVTIGVIAILGIGMLFSYDVIKINWISFMAIQPSYRPQSAPLPLPKDSVPVEGAAYVPGTGAPVNPVPADKVSLERGNQLYGINCTLCHGASGKGNGPVAAFLNPNKPVDLISGNIKNGSDGGIFIIISNGVPNAMPALRENLTVRERWDVVNYVRSLQK